jgi:hypothetical protein
VQAQPVDLSFVRENLGRFRVGIHHQRGTLAASMAVTFADSVAESLHLPLSLAKLAERRQGLVLVTADRLEFDAGRADRHREYEARGARSDDRGQWSTSTRIATRSSNG